MTDMTARATWTPGPWSINGTAIEGAEDHDGLTQQVASIVDDATEWRANARLIAAAPEMATFLHWLEDSPDAISIDGGLSDEAEQRLRALLARIEGER